MKRSVLILCLLLLALCTSAYAIPMKTAEHGTVPMRDRAAAQDGCLLSYYNFCSGWVFYWGGYCYGTFSELSLPPEYGVVFDLSDCPSDCRHLTDVWWACKRYNSWGWINIEICCANESGCPVGPPLYGWYGYAPSMVTAWQHLVVDPLPLCVCEESGSGKFAVVITDLAFNQATSPYSDIESLNVEAGCEAPAGRAASRLGGDTGPCAQPAAVPKRRAIAAMVRCRLLMPTDRSSATGAEQFCLYAATRRRPPRPRDAARDDAVPGPPQAGGRCGAAGRARSSAPGRSC